MPMSRNRPPHILLSSSNNGASSASNDSCVSQQSDRGSDHLPALLKYSHILEKSNGVKLSTKKCSKSCGHHDGCIPTNATVTAIAVATAANKTSGGPLDLYVENKDALYGVGGGKSSMPTAAVVAAAAACLQQSAVNSNNNNNNNKNKNQDDQQCNGGVPNVKAMSLNKTKKKGFTPDYVSSKYSSSLSKFEKIEIFGFPEVYFFGIEADKKRRPYDGTQSLFDNDQGGYVFVQHDHIGYRYELLKIIGKGSFGQVVKAYDHKLNEHVALKIVRNEKRFYRQAQEEIRILEHLRKQDVHNLMNIIHMFDSFTFRKHMCITFELLSINLYELIKKNKYQGFSLQLVRKFSHSLLVCLDALHRSKIIHCDMKPENVLLKQHGRSGIKVNRFVNGSRNFYFAIRSTRE